MASRRCVVSKFIASRSVRHSLALLMCSTLFSASADQQGAVWQYSKTADPMQGGSIAIASVSSDSVQALVRCWTKTGELDVSFLLAPGSGRADSEDIMIGFDERRDAHRTWRVSSNGLALVVPRAQRSKLLKRMRGAGNMRISLDTSTESAAQLWVPLLGSASAIGSVLKVCG